MTTGELVKHAREAIGEGGQDVDDAVFGRLARRMSYLPGDVNADSVNAQLSDGVLTVTIPKSEEAKPRQIEIKG